MHERIPHACRRGCSSAAPGHGVQPQVGVHRGAGRRDVILLPVQPVLQAQQLQVGAQGHLAQAVAVEVVLVLLRE